MPPKRRILLLDTNDAMGGVVRFHLQLLRSMDRARFELYVACLGHGPLLSEFRSVPDVTCWTMEVGTKSTAWCVGWRARLADAVGMALLFGSALRLAVRCRRAGIQVIHTSDKKRSLLLTHLLHRLTGIPYLYHIHAQYVEYPANRLALSHAAMIVSNSGAMRRDFLARLGPVMERIRLVYNCIDTERFSPAADDTVRHEIGAAPDDLLIGIASRLAPDKGQESFLQAAARVAVQEPRTRFVIVGDDSVFSDNASYVSRLRQLAQVPELAGRVSFLGYRADMAVITRGLDMVVVASWHEPFGLVVIEAMACGKPVVATDAGGIPEIITPGQDGLLFPPRDDVRLAEHLLRLIRDAELRRCLGAAARRTAEERFAVQTCVQEVAALYDEIAGKSDPGAATPAASRCG